METADCVVVGAGVVGLAVARTLAVAGREVLVLEAEQRIGEHTSSRNSEVIHAGLYYKKAASGSVCSRVLLICSTPIAPITASRIAVSANWSLPAAPKRHSACASIWNTPSRPASGSWSGWSRMKRKSWSPIFCATRRIFRRGPALSTAMD